MLPCGSIDFACHCPAAAPPKNCIDFFVLIEIFDDRIGDALAAEASAQIDELLRAIVLALKYRLVKIRTPLLQPLFGNFGVAEALQNPGAHFHVTLLRREPAVGFHRFHRFFLAHAEELVLRNDLDLYAALFIGAFDRLQDHVFSRRFGEDRDCLSFLDNPQAGCGRRSGAPPHEQKA